MLCKALYSHQSSSLELYWGVKLLENNSFLLNLCIDVSLWEEFIYEILTLSPQRLSLRVSCWPAFYSFFPCMVQNTLMPPNYLKIEITITVFCPPIPGCRRNILKGKNKKSKLVKLWSWQSQVGVSFTLNLEPELCTCFWSCMKCFMFSRASVDLVKSWLIISWWLCEVVLGMIREITGSSWRFWISEQSSWSLRETERGQNSWASC